MKCPGCSGVINPAEIDVEVDADEDGIELNFSCHACCEDFFAILKSEDFIPVD